MWRSNKIGPVSSINHRRGLRISICLGPYGPRGGYWRFNPVPDCLRYKKSAQLNIQEKLSSHVTTSLPQSPSSIAKQLRSISKMRFLRKSTAVKNKKKLIKKSKAKSTT